MSAVSTPDAEDLREWRIAQLILHLPRRLRRPVHWLRRPSSRWARIPAGILFMIGGVFAILPVLGLWMLPLGLVLLSEDVAALRKMTDRGLDWLESRRPQWFHHDRDDALIRSWDRNAGNWIRAVRDRMIPSRRAGTDDAILDAIAEREPKRLIDIGCGEGWLIRAAAARTGCVCVGVDSAASLIAAARVADPVNSYHVLDYDRFATSDVGAASDVAVFNYSLFSEDIAPVLRAAAARLAPGGAVVIQTLHPGEGNEDGWRIEDFAAFGGDWAAMPWFYRTKASWRAALNAAGLDVLEMREPKAADGRALSLLMICTPKPADT